MVSQYRMFYEIQIFTHFKLKLIIVFVSDELEPGKIRYCERFLEFLIDLESLLPTRRFFNALLDGHHVVSSCKMTELIRRPEGRLFSQVNFLKIDPFHSKKQQFFCSNGSKNVSFSFWKC